MSCKSLFCIQCNKMQTHNAYKEIDIIYYENISNSRVEKGLVYYTCSYCNNRSNYSEYTSKIIKVD